jgi:O-antigen/teichoic acid export membrane protein
MADNSVVEAPPSEEKRAGTALLWKGAQMAVSKVLYLVGSLVLGHLLAPNEFGLVAIAAVAITTLMAATETGMTSALVQTSDRQQSHYDVAWTIGLLRGSIVCASLFVAAPVIADLFGDARAAYLVRLMSFVPLITSVASPRQADLIRELKFAKLATVAITAATIDTVVAIALASTLGGAAIALGKLAGALTTAVSSYIVAPYRPRFKASYGSARSLVAFGRWLFAIGLTGVTSDLFLKILVARRLSVTDLGMFSMSDKLGETPSQFANEAIGGVAFPLYARLRDDPPRLQAAFRAHLTGLMFFLLPATGLLIALALPIQERILGPRWAGAAFLIVLLTLGYLTEFIFNAIYWLLQALGQGGRLYVVELTQYVVLITLVALWAGPYGLTGIGASRITTSVVVVIAGLIAIAPPLRTIALRILWPGTVLTTFTAIAGTAAWLCTLVVPGLIGLVVAAGVAGIVYLGLTWLMDGPANIGVRNCLSLFFPALGGAR